MVSWTQICAGEQLATMTLLMFFEREAAEAGED